MSPIVNRQMMKSSPYMNQEGVVSNTTWDAIKELYNMEKNEELMVF